MNYQEIPPFYEYPHSRGEPCDCLDCQEVSILNATHAAAKRRPHGTLKVRLTYKERSQPMPLLIDDCEGEGCRNASQKETSQTIMESEKDISGRV